MSTIRTVVRRSFNASVRERWFHSRSHPRLVILALIALVVSAPARAQYIYLDTDGDGVSTWTDSLNTGGATNVDVWLHTGQNDNGTPGFCGAPGLATYEFILQATGGTMSWGAFTNTLGTFSTVPALMSSNQVENHIAAWSSPPATGMALGAYKLGTISVTPASGTPCLGFASNSTLSPRYSTAFGTGCPGGRFDHTARYGREWSSAAILPFTPSAPPFLTVPGILVPQYLAPVVVQVQATPPACGLISSLAADFSNLPPGHDAAFSAEPGNLSGTLTWHPTPADHGEFRVTFTAIGRNPGAQASKSSVIHLVTNPVAVEESSVDPVLALRQNRPNPFNPATTIAFSLPQRMSLTLSIYDISGRRVAQLINGVMQAGPHEVPWAGTNDKGQAVASGVYCYQLKTPYGVETRRMVLAR